MAESPKLRVAIIGAGLGGLTSAVALKECADKLELDIYEATGEISEIGAGVTLWPRIWNALNEMGLGPDFEQLVPGYADKARKIAFEYRKGDQTDGFSFLNLYMNGGGMPFHRPDLQQALFRNIPKTARVHLNHRLVSYKEKEDGVDLRFQDGTTASCDLLIGADGVKSVVRDGGPKNHFRRGSTEPVITGVYAFRSLVTAERLREAYPNHRTLTTPNIYVGKNGHLVIYPIGSQKQLINVVGFYSKPSDYGKLPEGPTVRQATKEELVSMYAGWENEIQVLLNCVEKPILWTIQALEPLEVYVTDRVALLGDAAHAMEPHLGAGAGQAVEDAWILGRAISRLNCTPSRVPEVLQRYNAIRQPYGNMVLMNARAQGLLYDLTHPDFEHIVPRDEGFTPEMYQDLGNRIQSNWQYATDSQGLMDDMVRASTL
ncbi:salicylate hydroxylase [Mycena floridula]|nr:salicylate hydroxylase [Mycena floridula]